MALPDDVYHAFYSLSHITPKQLANLIEDNDPRGESLKYSHSDYKNTLQRIRDAVGRGDLTQLEGKYSINSDFNTQALFIWAIKNFPDFYEELPVNMIINTGGGSAKFAPMTGQSFALDLPTDYQGLRHAYIQLHLANLALEKEVDRLSVFEKKKIDKIKDSATGGTNSRGTPKSNI
jgi:hypothetical protein